MINESSQKIFNNSLLYSLGMIFSKAASFFMVPIYTYYLSNDEYGIGTTITTFVSTFGIVIMLSLRAAMLRFYNGYSELGKRRFAGTILSFVLLNAVVICTLLCLLHKHYMAFLFKGIDFFPCVFFGVLSLGAEGVYLVYQSLLQAQQNGKLYSLNSMVYMGLHSAAVVLFIALLRMGTVGLVLASFTTNACFAVYGVISMYRKGYVQLCMDKVMLVRSLKYSLPILPHNLFNEINTYAVKLIINNFISYMASGLYTLAAQFSSIVNLVINGVNLAFRPWFVEQMQCGEEGRRQIKQMSCLIMALYSFCTVGVSLFSKEIVMVMAEDSYWDAWLMIPLFVEAQLISFVYYSHVQALMYNEKASKYTVICSFSGILVNLTLSLILVEPLGIYGVLIGLVSSKIVLAFITVVLSRFAEKVDFGLTKMLFFIVTSTMLSALGTWISIQTAGTSFSLILRKLIIFGLAASVFVMPYRHEYSDLIRGIVKKKT